MGRAAAAPNDSRHIRVQSAGPETSLFARQSRHRARAGTTGTLQLKRRLRQVAGRTRSHTNKYTFVQRSPRHPGGIPRPTERLQRRHPPASERAHIRARTRGQGTATCAATPPVKGEIGIISRAGSSARPASLARLGPAGGGDSPVIRRGRSDRRWPRRGGRWRPVRPAPEATRRH